MDFIEGESELVSGFNIEYFGGGFVLIFLREYGIILFFRILIIFIFIDRRIFRIYFIGVWVNLISLLLIIMRALLPRIRYDELIYLC